MRAIVRHEYGSPDVIELAELEEPVPGDDGLLVRVHAASVNPLDWHSVTGTPYVVRLSDGLRRPKSERVGVDFAGTVEAVGPSVTRFRPGDEVFGGRDGAFSEYVVVREQRAVASKPTALTFEEAASVPVAAVTALQGLRDKGQLEAGQNVLINGASGGVGTFAVQIAKALGADVTGVCSTGNVDTARSLGADDVVDYTREDFTRSGKRYDLLLDIAGSRSWPECRRVLAPDAKLVIVGGPKTNRWIGPLERMAKLRLASVGRSQTVIPFIAKLKGEDLETLRELLEAGSLKPVIERSYELADVPKALAYIGEGHAHGKIVITV
jgi:NADPH:quinone reductase-like Zn-dependent oxidoreductase